MMLRVVPFVVVITASPSSECLKTNRTHKLLSRLCLCLSAYLGGFLHPQLPTLFQRTSDLINFLLFLLTRGVSFLSNNHALTRTESNTQEGHYTYFCLFFSVTPHTFLLFSLAYCWLTCVPSSSLLCPGLVGFFLRFPGCSNHTQSHIQLPRFLSLAVGRCSSSLNQCRTNSSPRQALDLPPDRPHTTPIFFTLSDYPGVNAICWSLLPSRPSSSA